MSVHPAPDLRARIAIIGGGLGGLVAALRLQQQGVRELCLFEARPVLGGRILSIDACGHTADAAWPAPDRFDLGPTWFWPGIQPRFGKLIQELGLPCFPQFEDGELLVERSGHEPPMRLRGFASSPPSMRLAGGTGALIAAIRGRLDGSAILHTGHRVRRLRRVSDGVELAVESPEGTEATWCVEQVLLALPPRLAAKSLAFEPPLPDGLAHRWRATATWMAPHAKYVAVYEQPFWREQGLSGGARSAVGPMAEIHDVSMPGGHAALFGFLGVPARARRGLPAEALKAHCRAQLARLFGDRAAKPLADSLKDWAQDPLTATDDDLDAQGHHADAPPSAAEAGPWHGRLTGIASEWSPEFPGYLAGAADAAERGVRRVLSTFHDARESSP